jgi:hypothetical protein
MNYHHGDDRFMHGGACVWCGACGGEDSKIGGSWCELLALVGHH